MKKVVILLFLVILISGGCAQKPQIANPASVYCESNGGTLEIRTDDSGGQLGYCKFSNGKECEEWAFYRQECNKESTTEENIETPPTTGKTYELVVKNISRDDTNAICVISSRLKNLDTVDHTYLVTSSIKLDGVEADSEGAEVKVLAGKYRFVAASFECPDNKKYELNSEVTLE